MKVIQALKAVKGNKEKIADLQLRIKNCCSNLSHETPVYGVETAAKIQEWLQSCQDTAKENVRLLTAIQKTNLQTEVTIELGGKQVTKTIAEWVWRRREYAALDVATWSTLTDRGLKEGMLQSSTGTPTQVSIVRHFDPLRRDEAIALYRSEGRLIDGALEVTNAITDLVE